MGLVWYLLFNDIVRSAAAEIASKTTKYEYKILVITKFCIKTIPSISWLCMVRGCKMVNMVIVMVIVPT